MNIYGEIYSIDVVKGNSPSKIRLFGLEQMVKLASYIGLPLVSEEQKLFFASLWDYRYYPKNTVLVKEESLGDTVFFIVSGGVKYYYQNTDEPIHMLLNDGNFALSLSSLLNGSHPYISIATCTNTHVLQMSKENFFRYMSTDYGSQFQKIIKELKHRFDLYMFEIQKILRMKSDDKITALRELNPELFQNIMGKYIASFLGIQTETYSRALKRI